MIIFSPNPLRRIFITVVFLSLQSVSVMKKLRRRKDIRRITEEEIDVISELPDHILGHILSFLSTKIAVRTCVLSKRWRHVWTFSNNLDFKHGQPNPFRDKSQFNKHPFLSFVNRLLSLPHQYSQIHKFRFSTYFEVDPLLVENCIHFAISHDVQQLKIGAFCSSRPLEIAPFFLNNSHWLRLTLLKLDCVGSKSLLLPKRFNLPTLTTLHLKHFVFSEDNFNGEIFTSCPNLENLVLSKCSIGPEDGLKILDISSLQLKNLEILNWRCPWECIDEKSISVSAPRLASFKCEGHIPPVCFEEGLTCLHTVCFDLCYPTSCNMICDSGRKRVMAEHLMSMLGEFYNVKSLTFSLNTIEILSAIPNLLQQESSTFDNLRSLRIKEGHRCTEMSISIHRLTCLLQSAPKAKTLVLNLSKTCYTTPRKQQHKRYEFGHLEHLQLNSGREGINITIPVEVVTYLLRSSPGAETLTVGFLEEA